MAETEENQPKKPNKNYAQESAKVMSVALELGFIIALPIVALATLGKWLDQREHTGYFIYLGIILAIISSSVAVYRRFAALIDKLNEAAGIKNKEQKDAPKENK